MLIKSHCLVLSAIILSSSFASYASDTLDSLKSLKLGAMTMEDQLVTYESIVQHSLYNEDSTLKYGHILYELAEEGSEHRVSASGYLGQAYSSKGDYGTSLNYLIEGLELAEKKWPENVVWLKQVLAVLYGKTGDLDKMKSIFLELINGTDNLFRKAGCQNSIGEAYYINGEYDSALFYYQQAYATSEELDYPIYQTLFQGNIGMTSNKLGFYKEAQKLLEMTVAEYEGGDNSLVQSVFLYNLGETYLNLSGSGHIKISTNGLEEDKGVGVPRDLTRTEVDWDKVSDAESVLIMSLEIGIGGGFKETIRDASELLSKCYRLKEDYRNALKYFELSQSYRDSIEDIEKVKTMARMNEKYEVGRKQVEVDLLTVEKRNQRNVLILLSCVAFILVILAIVIFKYYREKEKANQELASLNAMKDKFFSIISHDLRGPVSSFAGVSRIIKFMVEAKETEGLIEVADDIEESADRLSSLLDGLLTWAMQQQGQFPYNPESIELKAMTDELLGTLSMVAKSKSIQISVDIERSVTVFSDPNTTMTVLRNLIGNALKFTPESGKVLISAVGKPSVAEICIKDTGVGIEADKVNKLFEVSEAKSSFGTSGEKGLGLGLQLVRDFVSLNKGTICVESEVGKGTVFLVSLPRSNE